MLPYLLPATCYVLPAQPPADAHHRPARAQAALRTLALRHLGRAIQQGGEAGHDPTEDALAALHLAQLKLARGHGFGMPGGGVASPHEPLHAALRREGWRCVAIDRTAAQLGLLHAAPAAPAAPPAAAAAAASPAAAAAAAAPPPPLRLLPCVSDARAVRRAVRHAAGERPFVWLALRGAEEARARPSSTPACSTPACSTPCSIPCGAPAAHLQETCSRTLQRT